MNRTLANVIVDLAAAFLFVGMIATGYVLRFPLPPGTNRTLTLWGLARHEWGAIHYWISLGLLVVLAAHIVLHWKWLVTVVGKRLHLSSKPPSMLRSALLVTGIFAVAFGLFVFAVHWSVRELEQPLHELDLAAGSEPQQPVEHADAATESSRFSDEIFPLLKQRCVSCHGPDRAVAGFRADQRESYFGQEGRPVLVVPGDSQASPLIAIVTGKSAQVRPLKEHQLAESEVNLLRAWINAGADWPPEEP